MNQVIPGVVGIVLLALAMVLALPPLRRVLLSRSIFAVYRKALPQMSDTEREALEAGTVWWDGELFSGNPDWNKLLAYPKERLTAEEQAFLDNEVNTACGMFDDWKSTHEDYDLPAEVWQYIKDMGFLGMIIPKKYGGREFSAYAHSQVITRLSTRSGALAVSVMVPNSLGPAELLLHYGTDEQKNHYLPRLAKGVEIPAFALTSPWAGSDAASIPDFGVVCKGMWQGKEVLGMRVTWDKRYITLAPVCTILGLAFRLYDPDALLGGKKDIGITCALVPHDHRGVAIGRRHLPLNGVFQNGPTRGQDVFMPLDYIIGGPKMAGQGWRMLMECLAAGRSISLPSSNTGMAQATARTVGGYARVRSQFKTAVGRFEGVEEALARIGGNTYAVDAVRKFTAGAVDLGEKPSVVSAIAKYHVTERARQCVNDGMDIIGGKGICLGPSNFLGRAYQMIPVGITVEGANILTRNLILFGQGAIRCHPYVLAEMKAAQNGDAARGLADFDRALFGHLAFTAGNGLRALFHGLTGAALAGALAGAAPETRPYFRALSRFSAAFAFMADVSMLILGGTLKRRERISARLGDVLSMLYIASATLRRYELDGRQREDLPFMHWAVQDALFRAQTAFAEVLANYPSRVVAVLLKLVVFPLAKPCAPPSDQVEHQVAQRMIAPSACRDRLTAEVFVPPLDREEDPVVAIELAMEATIAAEPVEARIRDAERRNPFAADPRANVRDVAALAFESGVIGAEEYALLERRNRLRDVVIRVDDFPSDFGMVPRVRTEAETTAERKAA